MKSYKVIRIDMETYRNYCEKKGKIEKVLSKIKGQTVRVPFTKVLKLSSTSPIFYMGENSLIKNIGKSV